ncbi:MAG: hypothetical protein ACREHD_14920, partial [Pirellulales bacterium]
MSLDWKQHARRVFIAPKDNFNALHGWSYLENAGLNPYKQAIESIGMSYEEATRNEKSMLHQFLSMPLLPDFLASNRSKYNVLGEPESVDGNACWIVEWPGMDKIWVDLEHGHAVRRRVFHWKPNGPLARHVDSTDFREIKPGLWFCFKQIVESYASPEVGGGASSDTVTNRSTYDVRELDLARAPDGLTNLRLPVGTMVTDAVRDIKYTVTDDEGDPFAQPLGEATGVRRRTSSGVTVFVGALAVLGLLVGLYYFGRRGKGGAAVLFVSLVLSFSARAQERPVPLGMRDDRRMVDDKGDWSWKPVWLESNACGPNSLFVLLRLLGTNVTLSQVKDRVKCGPVLGCTMADLSVAASALGAPADVVFVRPDELASIPPPYILHG